jgi:hypothetical protein
LLGWFVIEREKVVGGRFRVFVDSKMVGRPFSLLLLLLLLRHSRVVSMYHVKLALLLLLLLLCGGISEASSERGRSLRPLLLFLPCRGHKRHLTHTTTTTPTPTPTLVSTDA